MTKLNDKVNVVKLFSFSFLIQSLANLQIMRLSYHIKG